MKLDRLMNFDSWNPVTRNQFARIREKMGQYISRRLESHEH